MRNIEFVSSTQGLDYEALSKLFFSVGFAKRDTRRLQRACEGAEGTAEGEELCGDEEVVAAPVRVVWARAIRKTRGTPPVAPTAASALSGLRARGWSPSVASNVPLGSSAEYNPRLEPGALLGFARATTDGALCACIWDVAVAPAWQRLGIGRALVERLATGLADDGITSLALFSEPGAVRMYERLGFVQAQAQGGGGVRGMNLQQKTKARIKGELAKEDAEADAQRRAQEVAEESRAAL